LHEEDPKLGFWNLVQEGNERRVLMTEEHYKSLLSMLAEGKISKWKKGTEPSPVTASAVLHS
jgi:hypothetical protein